MRDALARDYEPYGEPFEFEWRSDRQRRLRAVREREDATNRFSRSASEPADELAASPEPGRGIFDIAATEPATETDIPERRNAPEPDFLRRPAAPADETDFLKRLNAAPERRTVRIAGQARPPRRREPVAKGMAERPDRMAFWAVGLGIFMVVIAAVTGDAGAATP